MARFDILRQKRTADTSLGGVTIGTTAIETRYFDLQHLRGEEPVRVGGLAEEAVYRGFTTVEADVREQDVLTPDSGTTRYQVIFVEDLWDSHKQIFCKKAL